MVPGVDIIIVPGVEELMGAYDLRVDCAPKSELVGL